MNSDEARAHARSQVDRLLADGKTVIGVFENVDLGSRDIGRRVGFPYADDAPLVIGESRAPDHAQIGLGWRYILRLVSKDAEEVVSFIMHEPAREIAHAS